MRSKDSGRRQLIHVIEGSTLSGVDDFRRSEIVPIGKVMGAVEKNDVNFKNLNQFRNVIVLDLGGSN